jgi:hypothetical protein
MDQMKQNIEIIVCNNDYFAATNLRSTD